jgi:hypothetical protein
MPHYPADADVEAQLMTQGESAATLLARIIADGNLQDAVEYPDPVNPGDTLIDAAKAWTLSEGLGLIETEPVEGVDDGDR